MQPLLYREPELIKVYKYRERRVAGVCLPNDIPWVQELRKLIPKSKQDNHQVAVFTYGTDAWGRECNLAVWFHDYNVFVGREDDIIE